MSEHDEISRAIGSNSPMTMQELVVEGMWKSEKIKALETELAEAKKELVALKRETPTICSKHRQWTEGCDICSSFIEMAPKGTIGELQDKLAAKDKELAALRETIERKDKAWWAVHDWAETIAHDLSIDHIIRDTLTATLGKMSMTDYFNDDENRQALGGKRV